MGVELFGAAEASLLEHYLDTVEHLPDDVQRTISLLREIDQKYQKILGKYDTYTHAYTRPYIQIMLSDTYTHRNV